MPMLTTLRMRLPVWPLHSPLRTRSQKSGHPVEHVVHLRHHVLAIDEDRRRPGGPEGDVQDRAVFGDVDPVAREHGVDPLAQVAFPRQLHEESQRVVGDAVLRVIEVHASGFCRQTFAARWIVGKERAEVDVRDLCVVACERLPRRAGRQRCVRCRHGRVSFTVCVGSRGDRSGPDTSAPWQVPTCGSRPPADEVLRRPMSYIHTAGQKRTPSVIGRNCPLAFLVVVLNDVATSGPQMKW